MRAITTGEAGQRVDLLWFLQQGHHLLCLVHPAHQLRERIPEQTGDPQHHIHPRSPQEISRDYLQIHQTPAGAIPDGADADQRQQLGDVFTAIAHRGGPPHRQSQVTQGFTFILKMQIQQAFGGTAAQVPCRLRRQPTEIHGIEITTGGQHIRPATTGGPRGTSSDAAALQTPHQPLTFCFVTTLQAFPQLQAALPQGR